MPPQIHTTKKNKFLFQIAFGFGAS